MNAPLKIGLGVGAIAIVALAAGWYESMGHYEHTGIKLLHNARPNLQPASRKSMDNVMPKFSKTPVIRNKSKPKAEPSPEVTVVPATISPQQTTTEPGPSYTQNSTQPSFGGGQRGRSNGYIPRGNGQAGNEGNNGPDDNGPDGGPPDGGPGGFGGPDGPPPDGGGGPGGGGPGGGGPGGPRR